MLLKTDSRRWKALNNPFGFVPELSKPVTHPIVTKFEEFSEDQKKVLLNVKNVVVDRIGECEFSIFGSQVKGNWDENSDWDIIVHKQPNHIDREYLKNYNYGAKVDLSFAGFIAPFEKQVKF